jgi:WD repeat-containing protein 76
MFGDSRSKRSKNKSPKNVSEHVSSKSINSAFFSPSGRTLLSTTMANTLDIFENPHLSDGVLSPAKRLSHDNHTGRWLSTFMARWHPTEDIFVVGSMRQPRSVEIFQSDGVLLRRVEGEALTSVASRCCFHPRSDKLIAIGGNSSGRVIVIR